MPFTHLEKCDMLEAYLICRKNARSALRYYQNTYVNRQLPNQFYFLRLYRKFRSNEETFKVRRKKKDFIRDEETEVNVLAYFETNPEKSIRSCTRELDLKKSTVHDILIKHKLRPYKHHKVQTLLPGDANRRLVFCNWLRNFYNERPDNLNYILWTDESNFSSSGMCNKKNQHYWSRENPLRVDPRNPQHRFSLNVWCGLMGNRIVGPVFYHGTLTGDRYVWLLTEIFDGLFDVMPVLDRLRIHFQQDGAPPHNYVNTSNLLNETFNQKWLGTNAPIRWPARSPDLTPLDFYLWSFVKDEVYKQRYRNVMELETSIRQTLNNISGRTIRKATQSVIVRAEKCIEQQGNVFEHLLS